MMDILLYKKIKNSLTKAFETLFPFLKLSKLYNLLNYLNHLNYKNLQTFKLRITSLTLAAIILLQTLSPTVAWALTTGDSQPEIFGYQSAEASDNVSLSSGAFNYTIPITSIPEYPMGIAYSSGIRMDQEGGVFGIGFNGFSGAIGRSLMGIPDDVKGSTKKYTYNNQTRWDASVTGNYSAQVLQKAFPSGIGVGLGLSVSLTAGYNNYTGVYGALGLGAGLGAKLNAANKISPSASLGLSLISDSRESGLRVGGGAGIGIQASLHKYHSASESILGYGGSINIDKKGDKLQHAAYGLMNIGKSVFPDNKNSATFLAPLSYVLPNSSGFATSLTVPVYSNISVTGTYSQFKFKESVIEKKAYGFMHLNAYDRRNNDHLADITIEGEDSYNPKALTAPSYMQRDFFSINAMGLSGGMQLYQKEYGVVSRNRARDQYRNIQLESATISTDRKEVYPWVSVDQTSINKSVDILSLLKKKENPEDKDFDNVLFSESELTSLTEDKQHFGAAEFKMRGDAVGEYNLSSSDFKSYQENKFTLQHQTGISTDPKFKFLSEEKNAPLYYPVPDNQTQNNFNGGDAGTRKLEKGTQITYQTVGEILSQYGNLKSIEPNGVLNEEKFNFNQSCFAHDSLDRIATASIPKDSVYKLNNYQKKLNILKHLQNLSNQSANGNVSDLIGSIQVQNVNGLRYFFGLPAFNKTTKNIQLSGKGKLPPIQSGDDYASMSGGVNRNKAITEDEYIYPYAWLLTAIVGDDYVDYDNIPGPSDGDLGYWVKFRYVKIADNYRWRMPFTGLNHLPGIIHGIDDDAYSVSTGTKEIYHLSTIESSQYLCAYTYHKRFDALDAAGIFNKNAVNSISNQAAGLGSDATGNNFQFLVTQIDLYKKHASGDNSKPQASNNPFGNPIKSTVFKYDYSTSSNVPNNYASYNTSIPIANVPYYVNTSLQYVESGKATLRKVQHIAYDEQGNPNPLPSYELSYWQDVHPDFNPSYDKEQVDQWGNYMRHCKKLGQGNNTINYYQHYTEINKAAADSNAKAWHLRKISLPSGGSMEIDYQAQSYGYVQDKKPLVMRNIIDINSVNATDVRLLVDISDINDPNKNLSTEKVIKPGDMLYGEIAFYKIVKPNSPGYKKEDQTFIVNLDSNRVVSIGSVQAIGAKRYQEVVITSIKKQAQHPAFIKSFQQYMYTESEQMRALKEFNSCSPSVLEQYATLDKDGPKAAVEKVIRNVANLVKSDNLFQNNFINCYGEPGLNITPAGDKLYSHWSFLATPIYQAKYTGTAVKSISLKDAFQYATDPTNPSQPTTQENEYGTRYFYDENGNGTGASAGVATIEPGGGKSCVVDVYNLTGAGFAPSPSIVSGKTSLQNKYANEANANTPIGTIIARDKGKTVYEFYSAKDEGLRLEQNFIQGKEEKEPGNAKGRYYLFGVFAIFKLKLKRIKIPLSPPIWVPLILKWDRDDQYKIKSYAYRDVSDQIGRPKSIVQLSAGGEEIGNQQFTYYGIDEPVNTFYNDFTSTSIKKPGRIDQTWSEAFYNKKAKIKSLLLAVNAKTERTFVHTNMKYTYVPPILKEVSSTLDGLKTTTSNMGYDYYSNIPLEVKSNDSYQNTKIIRTVPAYWKYPAMGPKSNNPNNLNNLTATTATYKYLNNTQNDNLLGVGVVEWKGTETNTSWKYINYLQPERKYLTADSFRYVYKNIAGSAIKSSYAAPTVGSNQYIKRQPAVYKSFKGYTYEIDLDANGTFKNGAFTDFNYAGNNPSWKLLSTNQLYSQNGVLIQSQDVLNNYASQQIGYNEANTIGAVSNASWGASAYEGAENTYLQTGTSNQYFLESNKVQLVDAIVTEACQKTFLTQSLRKQDFPNNGTQAHIISISDATPKVYETPFAKLNVTYAATSLSRSLYISQKADGSYQVFSNYGEEFEGFFTLPQLNGTTQLAFNPNMFTAFQKDNIFPSLNYTTTLSPNAALANCTLLDKPYKIPLNDCANEAHTGNYAFWLKPGNSVGTRYRLSNLSVGELSRKYKALVWVHQSSPETTQLVAKVSRFGNVTEQVVTKASPYARAGNWVLLRLDVDLSTLNPLSGDYAEFFIRNASLYEKAVYDDLRVLPFHADMSNWVFDHQFNRVVSGLDNDHYASFSDFDPRGRVTNSAVEIESIGKRPVQKFLYNDQKKQ